MTNREIYNFDYFTIDNYKRQVKLAIEHNFNFVTYTDCYDWNKKNLLWRHDVEFSPDIALEMAIIENELGVKSTYFFQIHSEFYNIFEKHFSNILKKIKDLGHDIGLHFDAHYYNITRQEELDYFINLDKDYFEKVFNIKLKSFSFHNTTPFILSCKELKYGGLFNTYASFFKQNFSYCADSTGYWRFEVLEDVLKNPEIKNLQVLTHDAMWSKEVLSPRKRVRTSIQNNAERIKDKYDQMLIYFKAKNIDD